MSRSAIRAQPCISMPFSAKADGSVVGGHLIEAYVRPTLEVILIQSPSYLRKRKDPETGLALIDIA
jgi:predicted DNA-binding protein with PD1-like motif